MAKGNPLLGQLRGSIGDIVFSRLDGQQVSRARNRQPNNPRSDSQMAVRTYLKTASMAYAVLRQNLGDQTFQGNKIGSMNQRAFVSANVRLLQNAVANGLDADFNFARRDQGQAPINPYIISTGSLADPAALISSVSDGTTSLRLTRSAGLSASSTYADVCAALGLPEGSQLTFVLVSGSSGVMESVLLQRIILAPSTGDMGTTFLENNLPNLANPSNITDRVRGITFSEDGQLVVSFATPSAVAGVGCVASQKTGATWLYSNSQLSLVQPSGFLTLDDAIASWTETTAEAPAREYTRQADTSASIVAASDVTSIVARVYQYNDDEGYNYRRLVRSVEVNGNNALLQPVASDFNEDAGMPDLYVEVQFYGNMPRSYVVENLDFSAPETFDESSIFEPFKYTAGSKMYSFKARVATNTRRPNVVTLNDNNGNAVATVTVDLQEIPEPGFKVVSAEVTDRNHISLVTTGVLPAIGVSQTLGTTTIAVSNVDGNELELSWSANGGAPQSGNFNIGGLDINFIAAAESYVEVVSSTEINWSIDAS